MEQILETFLKIHMKYYSLVIKMNVYGITHHKQPLTLVYTLHATGNSVVTSNSLCCCVQWLYPTWIVLRGFTEIYF